jgi:outer membrane protein OmpA-like peptidoglycan-associated protein
MRNGDRFSGKLLNPLVKVQTEYMTAAYPGTELNRIDFASDDPEKVKLLLINGDIIQGKLLIDAIRIEPDSFAPLTADKSEFSSIQFNSRKMLLKEFNGSSDAIKDADRDGVPDHADHCSNTPWGEPVDAAGCPAGSETAKTGTTAISQGGQSADQDGDGVPDNSDKCPQTPPGAKVNERGCWPAQSILFDFGSFQVNRLYYPVLDNVFAVLKTNPALKVQIQGNTDNIGSEAYNQILSENRARAIKNYLVQKGIEPERISPVGYGSTRQAASNKTAAGRALNRRTEFLVLE